MTIKNITTAAIAAIASAGLSCGQASAHGSPKREEIRCIALQEVLNAERIEHEQMLALAKGDKSYAPLARATYERRARIKERIVTLCGEQWATE